MSSSSTSRRSNIDSSPQSKQSSAPTSGPFSESPQCAEDEHQHSPASAKQRVSSRPHSSSSQHDLHDLGFEDVDLDSPLDAAVNKTRSDHAVPPTHSHVMPIPFMQPVAQATTLASPAAAPDVTVSKTRQPPELNRVDLSLASDRSTAAAAQPFALPGHAPFTDLQQSDGQITISQGIHDSEHLAADSGLDEGVPSSARAGPFSTYSGPASTSSSTPASPGSGAGPVRLPSFLPRGMSTHLQKALRATAAAASKASAAIAPPANNINDASSSGAWQPETDGALPEPLPNQGTGQEQAWPFQQGWGPSGPASTSSSSTQERSKEGKPWWRQQLRNLQHNLQSPQHLQSEPALESDADVTAGDVDTFLPQPHDQTAWADSVNGNTPPAAAWDPSHHSIQHPQDSLFPVSPQHVHSEDEQIAIPDGKQAYQLDQLQSGTDSMLDEPNVPHEQIAQLSEAGMASQAAAELYVTQNGAAEESMADVDFLDRQEEDPLDILQVGLLTALRDCRHLFMAMHLGC